MSCVRLGFQSRCLLAIEALMIKFLVGQGGEPRSYDAEVRRDMHVFGLMIMHIGQK